MKIIIEKDYEAMSQHTCHILLGHMSQAKRVNVCLTAGRTPKRMYDFLVESVKDKSYYRNVHYYSFDETPVFTPEGVRIKGDNQSQLEALFFKPANIAQSHSHFLSETNYETFPQEIELAGGLDLMLVGIGEDGHICANMPESTQFNQLVYAIKLTDEFPWNAEYQKSLNGNYSDYMYTLGAKSILKAKHLIMIANGEEKADILKQALEGPISEAIPASMIQLHPNLTVITDDKAGAKLTLTNLG
ncbi:glucosamine-6-phosphate deaminase [Thorsellia anophelis]|uniref:6-phosphogluconolactonase/Glucosamine-6-phosphate isomerase/deaminase n=1 Tax=Thorsellia anophelis DSM 18579 TaxID=1123402 RepID=A0A1I0F6E9_9GAMM|nr:glucosamine-6-phosphate deaminase [Thorsellia anophelis]SET53633.1 6-phosphogluconolactonase/Glucosamine-6-phosphateisomerase/deaminase [Thorsellia anophelis DSM 18579]